jgi:hypothetical protein
MITPPAGFSGAERLASPPSVRSLILSQQEEIRVLRQENEQMRQLITALAAELASLRERIGRSSRNSSKPRSSDGQGFKTRIPRPRAKAVAASEVASQAIQEPGQSCCQWNAARRPMIICLKPIAAAVTHCREWIRRPTAIK